MAIFRPPDFVRLPNRDRPPAKHRSPQTRPGPKACPFSWRYLSSTRSIPKNSSSSLPRGSRPTRFVNSSLSRVSSCDTFATESLGRPVVRAERRTFPGAKPHFRLLVSGTHTTVAIRLWFNASLWTTTTGLRKPGPEPVGAGKSAHQISPWEITTRSVGQIFAQRVTEQSTPRPSRTPRKTLCAFEEIVGNRNGCFHTQSITVGRASGKRVRDRFTAISHFAAKRECPRPSTPENPTRPGWYF